MFNLNEKKTSELEFCIYDLNNKHDESTERTNIQMQTLVCQLIFTSYTKEIKRAFKNTHPIEDSYVPSLFLRGVDHEAPGTVLGP